MLALILAPLATELPEKVNSFFWVRDGKDSLALGNISGAMVFQSTIPVGIGLDLHRLGAEHQRRHLGRSSALPAACSPTRPCTAAAASGCPPWSPGSRSTPAFIVIVAVGA